MHPISAGTLPQTPPAELTALPRPLAGFGGCFAAGSGAGLGKRRERGVEGEEGEVEGREREAPSYC